MPKLPAQPESHNQAAELIRRTLIVVPAKGRLELMEVRVQLIQPSRRLPQHELRRRTLSDIEEVARVGDCRC